MIKAARRSTQAGHLPLYLHIYGSADMLYPASEGDQPELPGIEL